MIKALIVLIWSGIALPAWSAAQIIETATQASISQTQLITHLKQQDYILLGEVHDEPSHHLRRADLIKALAELQPVVVAEQLEANQLVTYTDNLLDDVSRAGFDAKVWDWALYSPLLMVLEAQKVSLIGGNLPISVVRDISKSGATAVPQTLRDMISQAGLNATGESQLVADLEAGHCGHLPKQYLPNFILAQRARDASMLNAMQNSDHKPVILLAGNGHVRKDYGIPTLIQSTAKQVVTIGFLQVDTLTPEQLQDYQQQFDYLWLTGAVTRDDPCVAFKLPHGN
ncbi:MAG: ChaN family lipoprotein [Methylophilus sp.]|nr:ChaN family lipoprotein [Methylophilus sp.]